MRYLPDNLMLPSGMFVFYVVNCNTMQDNKCFACYMYGNVDWISFTECNSNANWGQFWRHFTNCIPRTFALSTPHRWNYRHWLVMNRSLSWLASQWAGNSLYYYEQCPRASINLCWAFCQRIWGLENIGNNWHLVVIGFLLPPSKMEVTPLAHILLPFSHPVMEILLPTGSFS